LRRRSGKRETTHTSWSTRSSNWAFGEHLRRWRRKHAVSQDALAEIAGLHRTEISLIERGMRNVKLETIVKLADGLGITPAELLKDFRC
jgi:transcriptional regulator with XRE-family HTH domain